MFAPIRPIPIMPSCIADSCEGDFSGEDAPCFCSSFRRGRLAWTGTLTQGAAQRNPGEGASGEAPVVGLCMSDRKPIMKESRQYRSVWRDFARRFVVAIEYIAVRKGMVIVGEDGQLYQV